MLTVRSDYCCQFHLSGCARSKLGALMGRRLSGGFLSPGWGRSIPSLALGAVLLVTPLLL